MAAGFGRAPHLDRCPEIGVLQDVGLNRSGHLSGLRIGPNNDGRRSPDMLPLCPNRCSTHGEHPFRLIAGIGKLAGFVVPTSQSPSSEMGSLVVGLDQPLNLIGIVPTRGPSGLWGLRRLVECVEVRLPIAGDKIVGQHVHPH